MLLSIDNGVLYDSFYNSESYSIIRHCMPKDIKDMLKSAFLGGPINYDSIK